MLIRSPPHCRYITLSALVENCGPSIQTIHFPVNNCTPFPSSSSAFRTLPSSQCTSFKLNGSPNAVWATMLPSKKLAGRIPFVRSMICVGITNEPGAISSRREPTAENARTARTPSDLRAAMLAWNGMADGEWMCPAPCRARNATRVPEGRDVMVIGELGYPQGLIDHKL